MSNLGWYQWINTAIKKVGGPLNLLAIIGRSYLAVGGVYCQQAIHAIVIKIPLYFWDGIPCFFQYTLVVFKVT